MTQKKKPRRRKPLVIRLNDIFSRLARDCGLDRPTVYYCLQRAKHEGARFYTVTLPKLAKALLRSLEVGFFDRVGSDPSKPLLSCFSWRGKLLREFRGLLHSVFNQDGSLREDADPVAVWQLRQVTEYLYKVAYSFSKTELEKSESNYSEIDNEVRQHVFDNKWITRLRRNLHRYYPEFCDAYPEQVLSKYRPRFTSGAFAGSSNHEERYHSPYYVYKLLSDGKVGTTIRKNCGISGFFRPYPSCPERVRLLERDTSPYAEVLFVPKDSRGPRVISKEPMHALRGQMAYFDWATDVLSRSTSGRIQFSDQTQNQNLAELSSKTREFATLDLKDASDRVSFVLITELFRNTRAPRYFINQFRTSHAKLPSGGVRRIAKLAGMGSGLTFPTMALLIHLSVCSYVSALTGKPYETVAKRVHVYGDDLIVPTTWTGHAKAALKMSGLKVNEDKSFYRGFFRESCGADYFKGNNIVPVRLKLSGAKLPEPALECTVGNRSLGILELERHCRELVKAGLISLSEFYYGLLEEALGGALPRVSGKAPELGRYSLLRAHGDDTPVQAFRPVPVTKRVIGISAYKHLAGHLEAKEESQVQWVRTEKVRTTASEFIQWLENLGLGPQGHTRGVVGVPRDVKLIPVKVPSWTLGSI